MIFVTRGWFSSWTEEWGYSRFLNTFAFVSNFNSNNERRFTERGTWFCWYTLLWADDNNKKFDNELIQQNFHELTLKFFPHLFVSIRHSMLSVKSVEQSIINIILIIAAYRKTRSVNEEENELKIH